MEKTIISYDQSNGVIIEVTQIKQGQHIQLRDEIKGLGVFKFDRIDSDSFTASTERASEDVLKQLEALEFTF